MLNLIRSIKPVESVNSLGNQLEKAVLAKRVGTVSLLKDRVLLLAAIACISTIANVVQPAFIDGKPINRRGVWDIVSALGAFAAAVVLQYAGDEKYSTPKGLPGRNPYGPE